MIHFVLLLAIVGFICWLILQIPMPQIFKNVILGVICIVVVLWALQVLGVSTGFPRIRL